MKNGLQKVKKKKGSDMYESEKENTQNAFISVYEDNTNEHFVEESGGRLSMNEESEWRVEREFGWKNATREVFYRIFFEKKLFQAFFYL